MLLKIQVQDAKTAMSRRDWAAIGVEFISSNLTVEEFSIYKDIPYDTLIKQAAKNKWQDKRQASGNNVASKAIDVIVEDKAALLAKFDNKMLSIIEAASFKIEAGMVEADTPMAVKSYVEAAKSAQHVYRLALGASTDNQSVQAVVDFEAFVNDKLSGIDFKPKD